MIDRSGLSEKDYEYLYYMESQITDAIHSAVRFMPPELGRRWNTVTRAALAEAATDALDSEYQSYKLRREREKAAKARPAEGP